MLGITIRQSEETAGDESRMTPISPHRIRECLIFAEGSFHRTAFWWDTDICLLAAVEMSSLVSTPLSP